MPSFMGRRVNRQYSPHGHTTPPSHPWDDMSPSGPIPKYDGPIMGVSAPPLVIPGLTVGDSNPVPDTRAARKANSPKAKAKALKKINKKPLTPAREGAYNASEIGMERSSASTHYNLARGAERRLASGDYPVTRMRDKDEVASYKATGKTDSVRWLKKHGSMDYGKEGY
jgi:hypothetical protein